MFRSLKVFVIVAMWVAGGTITLAFLFSLSDFFNPICTVVDYRGNVAVERMTTSCRGEDGRTVSEQWVKVPAQLSCPTGTGSSVVPICYNGVVRVEDIGDFTLRTYCPGDGDNGEVVKYWRNRAAEQAAAASSAPEVVPMDPAPDAPAFVKEMDKRWGESGRGERYAAYERRLAWGTASIGGKKAVWYAWSNTDAGVTTWFNVVIPKSGMKVCRAPLGTYEGEAGYDCSYSRLLQKGGGERKYAPDPKGMKWTSIFNSIRFVSGRQWLDVEANATDWEGEGKLAAAALAAQIQRDFPVVKNMQVRQLLR